MQGRRRGAGRRATGTGKNWGGAGRGRRAAPPARTPDHHGPVAVIMTGWRHGSPPRRHTDAALKCTQPRSMAKRGRTGGAQRRPTGGRRRAPKGAARRRFMSSTRARRRHRWNRGAAFPVCNQTLRRLLEHWERCHPIPSSADVAESQCNGKGGFGGSAGWHQSCVRHLMRAASGTRFDWLPRVARRVPASFQLASCVCGATRAPRQRHQTVVGGHKARERQGALTGHDPSSPAAAPTLHLHPRPPVTWGTPLSTVAAVVVVRASARVRG